MRSAARVLLAGVAVLLATLGPPTTASAQEPPALPDSIAAIGDSISQAVDACCFYGRWPRHSWSTGSAPGDGISSHYERILARTRASAAGGPTTRCPAPGWRTRPAGPAARSSRAPSTSPS